MRLHERTRAVSIATADLGALLLKFQQERDLTNIEMMQAVNHWQADALKYMLRAERHPDNPDKGADEE